MDCCRGLPILPANRLNRAISIRGLLTSTKTRPAGEWTCGRSGHRSPGRLVARSSLSGVNVFSSRAFRCARLTCPTAWTAPSCICMITPTRWSARPGCGRCARAARRPTAASTGQLGCRGQRSQACAWFPAALRFAASVPDSVCHPQRGLTSAICDRSVRRGWRLPRVEPDRWHSQRSTNSDRRTLPSPHR